VQKLIINIIFIIVKKNKSISYILKVPHIYDRDVSVRWREKKLI